MFIFGGAIDNNVRSGETCRFRFSAYPKCALHDDFGRLLNSRLFCDVEFVVGGSSTRRRPRYRPTSPWSRLDPFSGSESVGRLSAERSDSRSFMAPPICPPKRCRFCSPADDGHLSSGGAVQHAPTGAAVRALPRGHHHQLNNYERNTGTTLEQDMEHFLNSIGREFCDITLMMDKELIPAHKDVLTARCSYFEGLFRSFMPPKNSVNIQIGEMIPSAVSFRSLLRYICYADVSMTPEDSLYLFAVPVFYGFTNNRLQAFCKLNFEMNVPIENVIQILEAGDKMQAHDTKNYALSLIVHYIGKVVRLPVSSSWIADCCSTSSRPWRTSEPR
uniref:BTB domain-containing protein n=1 Tax=Trichogramma kaykai TaxID=54128 RepID=A0ABD2X8D7_9HYME